MKKIFGIGTVVIDHVVELPEFPTEDTKVAAAHHWRQLGGPVPVALSTAAFYGSATRFLGRWGNDDHGRLIQETLTKRQIDTSPCSTHEEWSSGFAHVWVDTSTGTRTIAFSRGEFPIPVEADVTEAMLADCRFLHLDGWAIEAALKAAAIMKAQGGIVVLDAGSVKPGMDELLPMVDVLIASALFRKSRFGTSAVAASELLSLTHGSVITTDGANGSSWISAEDEIHEAAIDVEAIDTNGAGDVFSGCILHALANDCDRRTALQAANRVAGYACTQRGNSSLPKEIGSF